MATKPRRKKTSIRRKKTVRRRTTTRGKRKLPNWSLLVLGLAIGMLIAWLIQLIVHGMQNPDSGLNNLIKQPKATSQKSIPGKSQKPVKTAKPSYDFYTILPGTETPITDRDWDKQKLVPDPKGFQYLLQAASYSSYKDADKLKAKLLLNGLFPSIEKVTIDKKGTFYRVRVGPFATTDDVDRAKVVLKAMRIKPLLLKIAIRK